jgi:hypothetical protein
MTYRGHIKNGVAVLDGSVSLPEGTPVRVEVEPLESGFWDHKSVEQLGREQGLGARTDAGELAGDWPEEDSIEEFLAFLREARR